LIAPYSLFLHDHFIFRKSSEKRNDSRIQGKLRASLWFDDWRYRSFFQQFLTNAPSLSISDYEKMIRERDDMIECLSKCRELDEEYEQIFIASQQLDQNVYFTRWFISDSQLLWKRIPQAVLLELEKEKALEDQEMEKLMAELNETQNSLEAAQSRLDSVSEKLPALEARTVEAEEREREAIRISNEKDPQVEELGKWYEMR
jgi:hypothetical protein